MVCVLSAPFSPPAGRTLLTLEAARVASLSGSFARECPESGIRRHIVRSPVRPMPHQTPPPISPADLERGKAALIQDAAWASLTGALYGGVILVGFALELGAGPFTIGLLAAIPLIAQAVQLPAILLVERLRDRRRITVAAVTAARVLILGLALVPYLVESARLASLLVAHLLISILGSIAGCALNPWLQQLLPVQGLGAFFARRLFWATALGSGGTLLAGVIVDHWPFGDEVRAYSLNFALAGFAGFMSAWFLSRVPEPAMETAGPSANIWTKIARPLKDPHFRGLLQVIAGWNLATNFAAPFLTAYLLQQLGLPLSTVTMLSVASQLANAFTLYIWGRVSDRLSNKAILAVAVPLYFVCVLGLIFAAKPENSLWVLMLLALVHVVMGAAAGGIGLATGNISLKLAPRGEATAYLAAVGLVGAITGGIAPLLGGSIAHWFEAVQLSVVVKWVWSRGTGEIAVLEFVHWHFLFLLSALLGLYVLHALTKIQEGKEVSPREVVQELALEALRTVNQLSSIGGLLGTLFSFGRLVERRLRRRERVASE